MAISRTDLSNFLEKLSDELDIPDGRKEEAVERYRKVGEHLGVPGTILANFNPSIYPQGSFNLGTAVRPFSGNEEYDIDLVCELQIPSAELSQKQLKHLIRKRLEESPVYARILDKKEGQRCWTLNYAEAARFHMDILPAIPDEDEYKQSLIKSSVQKSFTDTAICITDNTHTDYEKIGGDWPRSNPKGYAEWFKSRMIVRLDESRGKLAKAMKADVAMVPDYKVKTPLQRAIQILKRHRDIMFEKDQDDKPTSIIISTLAAHAYNNEADLLEALTNIAADMERFITSKGGNTWVANPVNPFENFADKWKKHPQRETKFRAWLKSVRETFAAAQQNDGYLELNETLSTRFGKETLAKALSAVGILDVADTASAAKLTAPSVVISETHKPWSWMG